MSLSLFLNRDQSSNSRAATAAAAAAYVGTPDRRRHGATAATTANTASVNSRLDAARRAALARSLRVGFGNLGTH